jgi:hypothetical protein
VTVGAMTCCVVAMSSESCQNSTPMAEDPLRGVHEGGGDDDEDHGDIDEALCGQSRACDGEERVVVLGASGSK